ncbi:MAG: hypothetical protein HYX36_06030 [Rhizobiales bacterium]|nr:hypothetical protein [Hyphomicrobiales bacterium]
MADTLPDILTLPVETLNREFDAKLHLALRAVSRGWKVVLGGRTALHARLPSWPRSIYLSKGIRIGNRRMLGLIEALGHVIIALDEEALIRQSDEALLMMLDEATFNRPKLLYAWGRSNADVWKRFKGYHGSPILEVGNPRVDMLRPELAPYFAAETQALRDRFGRFVLFSSNFSLVNHYIRDYVRFRTAKGADPRRGAELKSGLVAHKAAIFEAFQRLIPDLARAIAPVTLVIRPHPSEDPQTWVKAAKGLANVQVAHDGPITPWLMAADVLIHNGCTSAVEAAIIGTRAYAFKPVASSAYDVELPDGVSIACPSAADLIAAVTRCLAEGERPKAILNHRQMALLRHHIASVDGPLCSERILDSLETHAVLRGSLPYPGPATRLAALARLHWRTLSRAVSTRIPGSRSSRDYTAHKFPGISRAMIESRIARFRPHIPGLPKMIAVNQLATDIFMIEKT